jgi:heme/copper-type cytochrome/quinol oxidase subunit 2
MIEGGGDAAGWSIFFLLAVILAVLGGIVFCMFRIARREKENFDPELSDDYHRPEHSH